MKRELFAELMESMGEALEHARGKRDLRTTVLPAAPAAMSADDIRALRNKLVDRGRASPSAGGATS